MAEIVLKVSIAEGDTNIMVEMGADVDVHISLFFDMVNALHDKGIAMLLRLARERLYTTNEKELMEFKESLYGVCNATADRMKVIDCGKLILDIDQALKVIRDEASRNP